jgi:hypothetical protein
VSEDRLLLTYQPQNFLVLSVVLLLAVFVLYSNRRKLAVLVLSVHVLSLSLLQSKLLEQVGPSLRDSGLLHHNSFCVLLIPSSQITLWIFGEILLLKHQSLVFDISLLESSARFQEYFTRDGPLDNKLILFSKPVASYLDDFPDLQFVLF